MRDVKRSIKLEAGEVQELSKDWEYFWEDGKQKVVHLGENGKLIYDTPNRWRCRNCGNKFYWPSKPKMICKKCKDGNYYDRATPGPLKEPWIPYRKPIASDNTEPIPQQIIDVLKDYVVLQKPIEYKICALWSIATYFYRQFQAFPLLHPFGILNSGKSRMLRQLKWFSCRAILHASCSPSVLVREIDEFHPTELIDEIDSKLNPNWESSSLMLQLLHEGYKPGSDYSRCKQGQDKGIVYHEVYCPKAIAGRHLVDSALLSRCIKLAMMKAAPKIKDMPKDLPDEIQEIRSKLLYLKLMGVELPTVDPDLEDRVREDFIPLLAVAEYFNVDYLDIIEYAKGQGEAQDQDLTSTFEADILGVIYYNPVKLEEWNKARPKTIASWLDVKPETVGYALKRMGIPLKRDYEGKYIDLSAKGPTDLLAELYKRYHILEPKEEE